LLHNEIELYDLNQVIFLLKKSFDLNRDLNQWFKSPCFKSANPDSMQWAVLTTQSFFKVNNSACDCYLLFSGLMPLVGRLACKKVVFPKVL